MTGNNDNKPVVIAGSGLVGSLLACYLVKKGVKVEIYERRDDMRLGQVEAGRSINLALSVRGTTALAEVGLLDSVMEIAIPMRGRMMHSVDGQLTYQAYSKDGKSAIYSVSRGDLNCKLMTLAEQHTGLKIHFNKRVSNFNIQSGEITFVDEKTKETTVVSSQTVLGCDGAFSSIRHAMAKTSRFDYSQSFLTAGYKELHIPPGSNGEHLMDKNCLHIWPRGSYMMIALPNMDGSFTVTCFFPFDGETGLDSLDHGTDDFVMDFFKRQFPDAVALMPSLLQDFRHNPTSSLVTVRCFPWSLRGRSCLFGDAAHAIVPFFGQGMNAGFEDCAVFNASFTKHEFHKEEFGNINDWWQQVFTDYQKLRKPNTDAIADMAVENFIEMRDKVADPRFLSLKKVQYKLGNAFPQRFISRYEMISFSRIPYKQAQDLGAVIDQISDELLRDANEEPENINLDKALQLLDKHNIHLPSDL